MMLRRQFLRIFGLAGASGFATLQTLSQADKSRTKTIGYRIQGFTCPTCAIGLDVVLERHEGVVKAKSDYSAAKCQIDFHPDRITEHDLEIAIAETGFVATKLS